MAADIAYSFPPDLRLRRSQEFTRVRRDGRKIHTRHFIIYRLDRPDGPTRLGLTVSRKVGGAVRRNFVKRALREFFRLNLYRLPAHADLSIIAKVGAADLQSDAIREELQCLCQPAVSARTLA